MIEFGKLVKSTRIYKNQPKSTRNHQKESKNKQIKKSNLHFHSSIKIKPSFPLSLTQYRSNHHQPIFYA